MKQSKQLTMNPTLSTTRTRSRAPGISIVVPTLNEAENIVILLHRIHAPLAKANIPHEILVVDDHSTDDTITLAHQAPANYGVRVLSKQGAQGKAYSLLEGFAAAEHDLVAMIDADLQYPPEAIRPMYDRLHRESADVVITERVHPQTTWFRQLSTKVFNLIFARLLFGIVYDTQSGLKLFRKSVLSQYRLNPSPWGFDLEFIVRAIEQEHRILSHKILFAERQGGKAKLHTITATFELIGASVRLRRDSSIKRFGMGTGNLGVAATASRLYWRAARRPLAISTGILCAVTLGASLAPASVSALSLPTVTTITQGVTQTVHDALGDNKKKNANDGNNNSTGDSIDNTGTGTTASPTAPISNGSSVTTTTSTNTIGNTSSSSDTSTSSASTTTPTTGPGSTAATAAKAAATTTATGAKTSATSSTRKATQASVTDKASSAYYNTNPLSTTRHSSLTGWAVKLGILGISLVILAGLITLMHMFRNAIRRTSDSNATRILQQGSAPTSS